jgi:hypothetical protein
MDDLVLIQQLQKKLKASFQNIGDVMISGGIDNMGQIQVLIRTGTCLPIYITGNL